MVTDAALIGPRITDADFFAQIDPTFPEMQKVVQAAACSDYATARRLFASAARASLQPERFFQINRAFRGRWFMYEGETPEQAAARILRGELISCSTPHTFTGEVDWFSNPTFNQYKEWTWQLSRHPEWGILAERYRATGDERYAEAFVRFFCSWVRQAVVPENADGGATLCWRTIEAGIRMGGVWQWALHSFYQSPHFTDDVLVDWYKSVWEHGWRLRNFHRTGNWLIMEMNGLAQIGILYPMFTESEAWKQYAFDRMVEELDAQIYPDGWQVELSTGYHQVDINNYQWLIDVCKAYDVPIPPKFRGVMERMHDVNVQMMMPDGRLPDLNDGQWHKVSGLMPDAVLDYPQRSDFRWALTEGKEGQPPAYTSVLLPYAGYAVMRSGWEREALWAVFDGGHFGYGHQHEDKLHLLMHAYGRLLLGEGGNYAYDESAMRRYVLSTRAHNTVRVDGEDQNRRLSYNREEFDVTVPSTLQWRSETAYDVAEAVYDEGYGPNADRSVTHHRKVIFLKQFEPGPCFVVIDRLIPSDKKSHMYQWLWHLDTETATINDSPDGWALIARSQDEGQANVSLIPANRADLRARIVKGAEEPEFQGWKAIKNHQQGEFAPTPTVIYETRAEGPLRLVTVIYPTRPGETCPIRWVETSGNSLDTTFLLQLTEDGRHIILDEADFERNKSI